MFTPRSSNFTAMQMNPPSPDARVVSHPVQRPGDDDGSAWRKENGKRSIERSEINGGYHPHPHTTVIGAHLMPDQNAIETQRVYLRSLKEDYQNSSFRMGPEYRRLIGEAERELKRLEGSTPSAL